MAPLISTLLLLVYKYKEYTTGMIKSCRQSINRNETKNMTFKRSHGYTLTNSYLCCFQ
ncbi:MAG: hypothetical protein ACI9LX_004167 [Paraglaciecola sp.]|jgi:hypothetical protein